MSPARPTPPSPSVFMAGAGARITRYQAVPAIPYVLPGTVGYLGSLGALTPYSPPGSGLPGAGNVPDVTWAWQTYGIRNDNTNITLDHVYIYGGIYWTGTGTATITNSKISSGTLTEFAALVSHGAGPQINVTDTTCDWLPGTGPDPTTDVGNIVDVNATPATYSFLRCAMLGSPQGVGPIGGSGNSFVNCYFKIVQNNAAGPNHTDGIFNNGANNTLIQGCYVDNSGIPAATAALFWQSSGPITGCTVTGNFLTGGSYTLYNENATNLNVTNNTFGGGINGDAINVAADGGTIGLWLNNIHTDGTTVPSP